MLVLHALMALGSALGTLAASHLDLASSANVSWTLTNSNQSIKVSARVPGGVYSDLMRAGVLTDVLAGYNDVLSRWVAYDQWTYTARFNLSAAELRRAPPASQLVLHGADTVAYVILNGHPLGRTDNMFVRYTYAVNEYLKAGENVLSIKFESPTAAARARSAQHYTAPACVPSDYHGECHANQLRKMQASFGWDWGPAFPSVGIWKPISIEFIDNAIIRSVTTHLYKEQRHWYVQLTAHLETGRKHSGVVEGYLLAKMKVDSHAVKSVGTQVRVGTTSAGHARVNLTLLVNEDEVSLWWPNGFGEQPLYEVRVELHDVEDATAVSSAAVQLGFRTVELVEENISLRLNNTSSGPGLTYYFRVNGLALFMKGSNWIPGHVLPELGYDELMIEQLLGAAQEAHMSMLRVWGGGVYESDYFYSRCDQLGLLVWQDFMFACAMYPTDAAFLRSVRTEIEQNVMRLQHHASVAVWAGNNENEAALGGNWYATASDFQRYKRDYVTLYVTTIKAIVEQTDPSRRYVVSSPSNGRESEEECYIAENPYSPSYGDTHYYNYLGDGWSMNIYPRTRFASEYGFQSFPSPATMRTATNDSRDFSLSSNYTAHRQHSPGGNLVILKMINQHLALDESDPDFFEKFIFYSQISQAMSIKAETEFYRQSQADWYTMGALYWQLNDAWQAPSWSSIEYGGRWKMLHYFAKNFFSPVLVSPRLLATGDIEVYLINDRLVPIEGAKIVIDKFNYSSLDPLESRTYDANIDALATEKQKIFISAMDIGRDNHIFFRFSLKTSDGETLSPENFVFPVPLKETIGLKIPTIVIDVQEAEAPLGTTQHHYDVSVTSDAVVLFLWLDAPGVAGRFLDNGAHVTSRRTRYRYVSAERVSPADLRHAVTYRCYVQGRTGPEEPGSRSTTQG